ncbi:MAG: tandem-95 repeat protein, partial [Cytophagales bacterium]|nr:tandem-95 repeat protein [Cytophagales bacterium]
GIDSTSIEIIKDANDGNTTVNDDGTITYTGNDNFFGIDTVQYVITGINSTKDTALLIINVNNVIDNIIAVNDTTIVDEEVQVIFDLINNDIDVDLGIDTTSLSVITDPLNGTFTINNDGTISYTGDENFFGTDSLEYTISGKNGTVDTATFIIQVNNVNDSIVVVNDTINTDEQVEVSHDVLENDSDIEGINVNSLEIINTNNGEVTDITDGIITYLPDEDFFGIDTITYKVCDTGGICDTAFTIVTVNENTHYPDIVDDYVETIGSASVSFNPLKNDSDSKGFELYILDNIDPKNGELIIEGEEMMYTPENDFVGTDSLTYIACNITIPEKCDTAKIIITVRPTKEIYNLIVYQGISPDDDGLNDTWVIDGIEKYPVNNIQIFNRWGNLVYEADDYNNEDIVWSGDSNQGMLDGEPLPSGTYYYVIELEGESEKISGFVVITK